MSNKDYYKILNVTENASETEIKNSYRQLSKTYHPDKNPDNPEAEEKFKEINEAYTVLSNKKKRSEYDNMRKYGFNRGGMSADEFYNKYQDLVTEFKFRSDHRQSKSKTSVVVPLIGVLNGFKTTIKYNAKRTCPTCDGYGSKEHLTCPVCNGTGMFVKVERFGNAILQQQQVCTNCMGTGFIKSGPNCETCGGGGFISKLNEIDVEIPSGVPYGIELTITAAGDYNRDLFVIVIPDDKDIFERVGDDIVGVLTLSFPEFLLGTEKEIEGVEKKIKVKIPKNSKPENKIRLRGVGLPNYHNEFRGDLILILKLKEIGELTENETRLLHELMKEKNFKNE